MIQDFHAHKEKQDDFVEACYHEAGHIAIARFLDPEIHITSKVYKKGYGEANIAFPKGTPEETKYLVGVAGCLGEAICGRGYTIDTEQGNSASMADNILKGFREINKKKKEKSKEELIPEDLAFKFEAFVNPRSQVQQTTTNDDDFLWRRKPLLDRTKLIQAIEDFSILFKQDQSIREDYKSIAKVLLTKEEYDSNQD